MCRDGSTKCGLFMAASILINIINHDQEVDVFYAVRIFGQQRAQFITSKKQYELLHQVATEYLRNLNVH